MAGYIGSKAAVTQVDGYTKSEADDRYVNDTGDTVTFTSNEGDALLIEQADGTDVGSLRINNGSFIIKGKHSTNPVQIQTHDGNEDIEVDPDGFIKMETAGLERMRINGDGVITAPSQPAFQVTKSGHQSNIAVGTATVTFDTEIFDQGSNFSSNAFTAPVTGRYQLSLMLYLDNLDSAANYYQAWIATSNRGYYSIFDPDYGQDNGYMFINASILADMDANDTAYVSIEMGANGNAQTDINATTKFSGYLVA